MALNPDQERAYIAELERMGPSQVRSDLDHGRISPAIAHIASQWLAERERDAEHRQAEQAEVMRRATIAAERQAAAVEGANKKANLAIVISVISIIATIVGIWIAHLDVLR